MRERTGHQRESWWKAVTLRVLCTLARWYFRTPIGVGKAWVWLKWVEPYLAWRDVRFAVGTIFGSRLLVTNFASAIDSRIYFFGVWEPAITRYFLSALRPGDTFIDVGANIGYYSLLAASKVGLKGQVFAFEASPSIFAELQRNLQMNGAGNVVSRNVAVTNVRGRLPVFKDDHAAGLTSVVPTELEGWHGRLESTVEGCPLPELIDPAIICSARIIKIDVEGAEWLVIGGMRSLLHRLSPTTEIVMEINDKTARRLGGSAEELIGLFTAADFEVFEIPNSYSVESYIARERFIPRRYRNTQFDQKDFLFRKRGKHPSDPGTAQAPSEPFSK